MGSEMCIRDRPAIGRCQYKTPEGFQINPHLKWGLLTYPSCCSFPKPSNCRISAEAAFGDGSARENGRWGIGMQIIVPYWQKEYIHGMIEFVVVGIVSISA